jgi:hypothetical protein
LWLPKTCKMAISFGWTKRHKITIDKTKVTTGAHTDFPILLSNGNFLDDCYTNAKSDGSDIRFSSDQNGASELAFELVSWNQGAKTSEVWVKIPSLGSATDTVIYVWYKNPSASALSHTDTYGTHAVWSNGFQAVWHLEAGGQDSSPNGYDMTVHGSTNATGKIGKGYEFPGDASNYLEVTGATNLDITGAHTLSLWGRSDTDADGGYLVYVNNNCGIRQNNFGATYDINFSITGITNAPHVARNSNLSFIAGTYNGTNSVLYRNKSAYTNGDTGTAGALGSTWWIGKLSGTNWPLDGLVDEARVANVARSAAWLATEYDNQNDPSTFSTGSDAQKVIRGGAFLYAMV